MAGCSWDNAVTIWETDGGKVALTYKGQKAPLWCVAWSPDGHRLATASRDGTSRVYIVDLNDLVDLARSKVTRGLTEEECQKFLHEDHCPN